jgi:hypothetical protein
VAQGDPYRACGVRRVEYGVGYRAGAGQGKTDVAGQMRGAEQMQCNVCIGGYGQFQGILGCSPSLL